VTLKQALCRAREILAASKIENASLEVELLLRHTLNISQVQLYLDFDRELSPEHEETFRNLTNRRLTGEPSAYITGHREFYCLDFYVNPGVLIPRPESELLVDKALELAQNAGISTVAEIGTGCGAIAISLALNLPETMIYATDISPSALKVASSNCRKHGVENRICRLQGDMLDPLPEPVDLIIANLPYVAESELAGKGTANFEPVLALNGGSDGLKKIYKLCRQAIRKLCSPGYLLLEIGQGQGNQVAGFLHRLFPSADIEITPDLSGIDRLLSMSLTPDAHDAKLDRQALTISRT